MLQSASHLLVSLWKWLRGYHGNKPIGMARPLGNAEKLFFEMNQRGILLISSVVFISSRVKLRDDNIKWALKRLMHIHPLLRMKINDFHGVPHWMEMDDVQPEFRVDLSTDWHEVFSQNTLEKYAYDQGPLWRVTFMPNAAHAYGDDAFAFHCAFVFAFSHVIIDGQGRMKLMNDFQDLLAESLDKSGSDFSEIDEKIGEPVSLNIAPTPLEIVNAKLSIMEKCIFNFFGLPVVKRLVRNRLIAFMLNKLNPFMQCIGAVADTKQIENPTTCVYPMVIESNELSMILKACKRHGVTMQSVIQAASTISICELILKAAREKGIADVDIANSNVVCAVAMKQHLPAKSDISYVAAMIYPLVQDINVPEFASEERFWEFAQQVKQKLHSNSEFNMKLFVFFQSLFSGHAKALPKTRSNLLSFTNLGNCNYLNRDLSSGVKVTAHYSASGEHVGGPVFANCITTLDNRMFWGAVYYTNVSTRELAADYLKRAVDLVLTHSQEVIE